MEIPCFVWGLALRLPSVSCQSCQLDVHNYDQGGRSQKVGIKLCRDLRKSITKMLASYSRCTAMDSLTPKILDAV